MSKKLLDHLPEDIRNEIVKEVISSMPADELKKAWESKNKTDATQR